MTTQPLPGWPAETGEQGTQPNSAPVPGRPTRPLTSVRVRPVPDREPAPVHGPTDRVDPDHHQPMLLLVPTGATRAADSATAAATGPATGTATRPDGAAESARRDGHEPAGTAEAADPARAHGSRGRWAPGAPTHLRAVTRRDDFGPRPTSTDDLPEPRGWAGQMPLTTHQVVSGLRPPTQLARFVAPPVYESMVRRRATTARRHLAPVRPTRVRAVVASEPRDGVVDASVVLFDGHRAQAVAMRMTGVDGRWLVTELQIVG